MKKRTRQPRVVKGTPDTTLSRAEFDRRFRARFFEPAQALANCVRQMRSGRYRRPDADLQMPRQK